MGHIIPPTPPRPIRIITPPTNCGSMSGYSQSSCMHRVERTTKRVEIKIERIEKTIIKKVEINY